MLLRSPLLPCLVLLAVLAGCGADRNGPRPADGRLELTADELAAGVRLDGPWRAHPGAAPPDAAAFDHDDRAWRRVPVPSVFREQGFPDDGLVTYRLHLRLPPDAPPLRGYVLHAGNAHALYAARPGEPPRRLAASGVPAPTAGATRHSRRPVLFDLPQDTALVLTWQVASFGYRLGGPLHTLTVAPADVLYRDLLGTMGSLFTTFGLYLFLALSFAFYWRHRREDAQLLAVALVAGVMALRTIVVGGVPDYLFPDAYPFRLRVALEAGTYAALNGLFAWLVVTFFPGEFAPLRLGRLRFLPPRDPNAFAEIHRPGRTPSRRRRFNAVAVCGMMAASAALTALVLAAPPEATARVLPAAFALTLAAVALTSAVVVDAIRRRRPLAVGMAVGMGVLFAGCLHDLLLANGLLPGRTYLTTYAFLAFLVVQSSAIAHRHATYARLAAEAAGGLRREVRQRTKELRATAIAAHAASLAKGQFVAAVSHELRTPLGSILGYAQLLRENLGDRLQRDEREFIATIETSGRRLIGLVNDLLDVAQLEAGRLELRLGPVHAATIAGEVADALYPLARSKNLGLHTDAEDADGVYVQADAERLRQVLINLVSNAVKFTEAGHVTIRLRPATLHDRPALALSVEDTGPGISPDFLPRLFDRFSQDPVAYNRTQRGTGLGLTISREFVLRMDGTIEVDTGLGEGSTFTVTLPRAAPPPAAAPRSGREAEHRHPTAS